MPSTTSSDGEGMVWVGKSAVSRGQWVADCRPRDEKMMQSRAPKWPAPSGSAKTRLRKLTAPKANRHVGHHPQTIGSEAS